MTGAEIYNGYNDVKLTLEEQYKEILSLFTPEIEEDKLSQKDEMFYNKFTMIAFYQGKDEAIKFYLYMFYDKTVYKDVSWNS